MKESWMHMALWQKSISYWSQLLYFSSDLLDLVARMPKAAEKFGEQIEVQTLLNNLKEGEQCGALF